MTKTIQNGGFTNTLGTALTGNLLLVLSQDAKVAVAPNQLAPVSARIPIAGGNIAPTLIYFNDELLPNNTYYTATVYDATGNKVYGPEIWSLTGTGPLDLGTLTPLLISPDPLFSNPVLQNPAQAQTITGFGLTLATSAPLTVLGGLTANKMEGIQYVDSTLSRGGVDICDETNKAYAALPTAGGEIYIAAGSYACTVNIAFGTSGKVVRFHGAGMTATTITWSNGAGTHLTLDTGNTTNQYSVLEDFFIQDSSSAPSSTCLAVGTVNFTKSAQINRVAIFGCKIGAQEQGLLTAYDHVYIQGQNLASTSGLKVTTTGDSPHFTNGSIAGYALLLDNSSPSNGPITFSNTQFSGPSANGTAYLALTNEVEVSQCHFTNGASFPQATYFALAAAFAQLKLKSSVFEDDRSSGTASGATCSQGVVWMDSNTLLTGGATAASFLALSGTCVAHLWGNNVGSSAYTTLWNTAYTGGPVDYLPTSGIASDFAIVPYAIQLQNLNVTVPTNNNPTFLNLAGIGPTISGAAFRIVVNSGATDAFDITGGGNTQIKGSLQVSANGFFPSAAAATDVGTGALPFGNLWLGTAATNNFKIQPGTATGARIITITDPVSPTTVGLPLLIANGTTTLTSGALAAATCQAVVTTAATGVVAATDSIEWAYATNPATGDAIPNVSASLSTGSVNFTRCNASANSQTTTAIVINWRVVR